MDASVDEVVEMSLPLDEVVKVNVVVRGTAEVDDLIVVVSSMNLSKHELATLYVSLRSMGDPKMQRVCVS